MASKPPDIEATLTLGAQDSADLGALPISFLGTASYSFEGWVRPLENAATAPILTKQGDSS